MESYCLPIPKHRKLLTLRSGPRARNGLQSELPAKFGIGRSKLPEAYIPRDKKSIFLDFQGGEINNVFDLTLLVCQLLSADVCLTLLVYEGVPYRECWIQFRYVGFFMSQFQSE